MNKQEKFVDITIENLESTGRNSKQKEELFKDKAFGMFIHWSLDSYIGCTISHWMCGAEYSLIEKFIHEIPKEFNPIAFSADSIAALAKEAGMKYTCFTAKHHNGFCMFPSKTTDFNIMNTPFQRDIVKEILEASRRKGLMSGLYFSPLDFLWNYKEGHQMQFATSDVIPKNNPGLMEYNKAQMNELLSNYGAIDLMFLDGPPEGLKEQIWDMQPECLVTRGEMPTYEIGVPNQILNETWEACYYTGESWGYKPYYDNIPKEPLKLIELLIKTRAMGGNLLLNVTPSPTGEIPAWQVELLREIGLYLFFNGEAIYEVRPYKTQCEGNIWYTRAKNKNTVYAFVLGEAWDYGYDFLSETENWHNVILKNVKATKNSKIELVGQSGLVLQHRQNVRPATQWYQDADGLHIKAMVAFRPNDNRKWSYPVCIRITDVEM